MIPFIKRSRRCTALHAAGQRQVISYLLFVPLVAGAIVAWVILAPVILVAAVLEARRAHRAWRQARD